MRLLHHSLALFAALSLTPITAHAGAWLQKSGKGIAVAQATYFSTDKFYDENGNRRGQNRFDKTELNIYAEYGLYENLTIGTNVFANYVEQAGEDNVGVSDAEFFIRTPLYEDETWMVSLQPLVKLPSEYDKQIALRGGSRSTDMELSALVGVNQPIISNKDFIDTRIGYRERNRGLDGQWRADATVGVYPTDDLLITTSVRSVISNADPNGVNFREDGEQEYSQSKIEVGAQYALSEDYWLQVTAFSHVDGELAGGGEGISIGVGMRF